MPPFLLVLLASLAAAVPLRPEAAEGVARVAATDALGLGREAAAADGWLRGRERDALEREGGGWVLRDSRGGRLPLSDGLGLGLRRLQGYFDMTEPTLARPVTYDELRAALLSPAGVAEVERRLSEAASRQVDVAGRPYVPELGGSATMGDDGTIRLHAASDAGLPFVRRLVALRRDYEGLRELARREPALMARVDPNGIIARDLKWQAARPEPALDVLSQAVDTVADIALQMFGMGGRSQLEELMTTDWGGRNICSWHLHPPDWTRDGWAEPPPPSDFDLEAAGKTGEELVITWHPDGFDVHYLTAPPLLDRSFSYRR